jgi:hypothetical protein
MRTEKRGTKDGRGQCWALTMLSIPFPSTIPSSALFKKAHKYKKDDHARTQP